MTVSHSARNVLCNHREKPANGTSEPVNSRGPLHISQHFDFGLYGGVVKSEMDLLLTNSTSGALPTIAADSIVIPFESSRRSVVQLDPVTRLLLLGADDWLFGLQVFEPGPARFCASRGRSLKRAYGEPR